MNTFFIFNKKTSAYWNSFFEKYDGMYAPYKATCTLNFIIIP